jgi:hypothetical protein
LSDSSAGDSCCARKKKADLADREVMGSWHRKQKISYARTHKLAKILYEVVATETNP